MISTIQRPLVALFLVLVLIDLVVQNALSQSIDERPTHTSDVINALNGTNWTIAENGVEYLVADSTLGVRVTAFKFDPKHFDLSIVQQKTSTGEDVESFAKRTNAYLAINGGFFASRNSGKLYPVGRLKNDGKIISKAWRNVGGYLIIDDDGVEITPTRKPPASNEDEYLQSKPVIIEEGGNWALNNNLGNMKRRSLVCTLADKSVIIIAINRQGLSLFEAGWLLRSPEWGGWFNCDAAIALDGGGSTQLHVPAHPDLSFTGNTAVQNALIVKRKARN